MSSIPLQITVGFFFPPNYVLWWKTIETTVFFFLLFPPPCFDYVIQKQRGILY